MTSDDHSATVPAAQITIRQLVAFRNFARDNQVLANGLECDHDAGSMMTFEASICGFALAALAKIFDMNEAVIAVVDEAQYRQRQIRFYKSDATGEIMMALSGTIDGSIDLDLANANAFEVLEALDLEADHAGTVTLAVLRARLCDPAIRRPVYRKSHRSLSRAIGPACRDRSARAGTTTGLGLASPVRPAVYGGAPSLRGVPHFHACRGCGTDRHGRANIGPNGKTLLAFGIA